MTKSTWPDWAESWDGRKHCKKCGARLVVVQTYTGSLRYGICSDSGRKQDNCDAT